MRNIPYLAKKNTGIAVPSSYRCLIAYPKWIDYVRFYFHFIHYFSSVKYVNFPQSTREQKTRSNIDFHSCVLSNEKKKIFHSIFNLLNSENMELTWIGATFYPAFCRNRHVWLGNWTGNDWWDRSFIAWTRNHYKFVYHLMMVLLNLRCFMGRYDETCHFSKFFWHYDEKQIVENTFFETYSY